MSEENKNIKPKDTITCVVLNEPIDFEGRKIESIDYKKIETFTLSDLQSITQLYKAMGGSGHVFIEADILWVKLAVQQASGLPLELLDKLNIRDAVRLRNRVAGFFYDLT